MSPAPPVVDRGQPVEHLEVLIEAEKVLVRRLRSDTNDLNDELQHLEEACRFEERETARERAERERISRDRQHLLDQLEASQQQLHELKAEHQGLHIESMLLRRDNTHYGKEAAFLQRLFDEGMRDAQALQQSVEYLEQSNQSLMAHTKSLEEARREILEQVRVEKDLLNKEQREALAAKQVLEALKSEGADVHRNSVRQVAGPQGFSSDDGIRHRRAAALEATKPWNSGLIGDGVLGLGGSGFGGLGDLSDFGGPGGSGFGAAEGAAAGRSAPRPPPRAPLGVREREGV